MALKFVKASAKDAALVIAVLSSIYPVSKALEQEFINYGLRLNLKKGEYFVNSGDYCKHLFFIKKGAMMGYTHHHKKQITTYISIENEFVSSLSGLYGKTPSREAIVALEDTCLLGVETDSLLDWYQKYFDLNYIIRVIYESYYCDAQERSHIIRVGNAKERYRYFLNSRRGNVDKLPVEAIASFLNMKPSTLAGIKNEIRREVALQEEFNVIAISVEEFIVGQQAFKIPKISLKQVALEINVPHYKLTQFFANHLKVLFKDYINKYRITHYSLLSKDPESVKKFTVDALAHQAGFSSKNVFYNALKKFEK